MGWYWVALKKYAIFSGRSTRKEFWLFSIINMIINLLLMMAFFVQSILPHPLIGLNSVLIVVAVFNLFLLLPTIGVSVRRLHDVNRSGWLLCLNLIPVVGSVVLIFFFSLEGSIGDNSFGEDPIWVTSRRSPITV